MARYKPALALMLLFANSFVASEASAVQCAATITAVSIEDTGNVYISTSGQVTWSAVAVCNVDRPVGRVRTLSTKVCDKMHGQFMAALLAARQVTLWFAQDQCPSIEAWHDAYSSENQFYNVVLR
jgi:hypothetical protein